MPSYIRFCLFVGQKRTKGKRCKIIYYVLRVLFIILLCLYNLNDFLIFSHPSWSVLVCCFILWEHIQSKNFLLVP